MRLGNIRKNFLAGLLPCLFLGFFSLPVEGQPFLSYDFSTDNLDDFNNPTVVEFCCAQGGIFGCSGSAAVDNGELLLTNSDSCDKVCPQNPGDEPFWGISIATLTPATVQSKFPAGSRDYKLEARVNLETVNELVIYLRGRMIFSTYQPTGEQQVQSFYERGYEFALVSEFTDEEGVFQEGALILAEINACHLPNDHLEWPGASGPGLDGVGFAKIDPGFPIANGQWYRVQLSSHGNDKTGPVVLAGKIWPESDVEPEYPQIIALDPDGLPFVPPFVNEFQVLFGTSFDFDQQPLATARIDDLALTQLSGCPQAPVQAARKLWDSKASVEGADVVSFEEGVPYPVILNLSSVRPAGSCAAASAARIVETVPAGWAVTNISNGGSAKENIITWNVDLTAGVTSLTYTVTPAPGGRVSFSGLIAEPGSDYLFVVTGETTAVGKAAIPPVSDFGSIQHWLILGPFKQKAGVGVQFPGNDPGNDNIRLDYLTDKVLTEATILPKAGDTIRPDYGGAAASSGLEANPLGRNPGNVPTWIEWIDLDDADDRIDFESVYSDLDNIMCHAVTYLNVEDDIAVNFGVSSDDSVQLLLDGKELHIRSVPRGALGRNYQDRPDSFPNLGNVELTRGQHTLMVKVFEGGGEHNFRVGFLDEFGLEIPGGLPEIAISLVPEARPQAVENLDAAAGDKQVTLAWAAPAGEPAPAGYNVYQTSPEPAGKLNASLITGTQYVHTGRQNGTRYCYAVKAALATGTEGAASAEACATPKLAGTPFRRGDVDSSGAVDISDPINELHSLFLGDFEITCQDAADFDDSGLVDISDAINSLLWQFASGAEPPAPGPFNCGLDETPDLDDQGRPADLGCQAYTTDC